MGVTMKNIAYLLTAMLLATVITDASAHGGGLDSYGCHNNRKVGNYHCHRGEFAGKTFASKDAMLKALREKREKA